MNEIQKLEAELKQLKNQDIKKNKMASLKSQIHQFKMKSNMETFHKKHPIISMGLKIGKNLLKEPTPEQRKKQVIAKKKFDHLMKM